MFVTEHTPTPVAKRSSDETPADREWLRYNALLVMGGFRADRFPTVALYEEFLRLHTLMQERTGAA